MTFPSRCEFQGPGFVRLPASTVMRMCCSEIAAPLVAGVITGFLPLDTRMISRNKQDFLVDKLTWQRRGRGAMIVWNDVDKVNDRSCPPISTVGSTSFSEPLSGLPKRSVVDRPDISLPQTHSDLGQTAVARKLVNLSYF